MPPEGFAAVNAGAVAFLASGTWLLDPLKLLAA
jgi:hypothetical protein